MNTRKWFLPMAAVGVILIGVGLAFRRSSVQSSPDAPACPPIHTNACTTSSGMRPELEDAPKRIPVDKVQLDSLRTSFVEIAVAYSNRQAKAMREIFTGISGSLRTLPDDDFRHVEAPVYNTYDNELFFSKNGRSGFRPPDDYSSVEVFRSYAESLWELVRILGDTYVVRGEYWKAKGIESFPLHGLKKYHEKFTAEGRAELAACAGEFVARWIEFIESEKGYSRRYMHYVFRRNLRLVGDGETTREEMVRVIRIDATVELQRLAEYTPKWINEIE